MNRLLTANLRAHARRYLATGLAVMISTAFIMAFLALGNGMNASLTGQTRAEFAGAAAVLTPAESSTASSDAASESDSQPVDLADLAPRVEKVEGIAAVVPTTSAFLSLTHEGARAMRMVSLLRPVPFSTPIPSRGVLPRANDEILLDASAAKELGVDVGDEVEAAPAFSESGAPVALSISGIVDTGSLGRGTAVMTGDGLARAGTGSTFTTSLLVAGASDAPSSAEQKALVAKLAAALGANAGVDITTADAAREAAQKEMGAGSSTITAVLLIFPVISVIVAMIVVSSTFRVLMTQRRRELALLRAVGATGSQIRSLVLREALLVGAASSALGAVLGALLGALLLAVLKVLRPFEALAAAASPLLIGSAFLVGLVMTLVSGIRPALAMGRLSAIEALSNADAETAPGRSHRRLVAVSLVVALLACAGMGVGLVQRGTTTGFLVAFLSGAVCLIAMMIAGLGIVPALAGAWGRLGRGSLARLARGNALRNPGRTASTGVAIAIGVALIAMMSVGAGSVKATLETEVYSRYPFDLAVSSSGAIDEDGLARIRSVEGVEAAVPVRGAPGTLSATGDDADETGAGSAGSTSGPAAGAGSSEAGAIMLQGIPDLSSVVHSPVDAVDDSTVRVGKGAAKDGAPVEVCAADGSCATLTARVDEDIDPGRAEVSAAALERISPKAPIILVPVKIDEDEGATAVQTRLLSLDSAYSVSGPAIERATYSKMIDTVLSVVIAMLAVSVLVALVGVTNTLGLSVAERTRETGLLRALGMTRRSIRSMLAIEAAIIALAGASLGLVLGIAFGVVGAYALPLELARTVIEIPWGVLGLVVAGSVGAALVASWWPGRRAARTSPVEALATE